MKQNYFLLSIGIVITIGIAICFLQMKTNKKTELFDDHNDNINPPLRQKSSGIGGDKQALIFWNSIEDEAHPIHYFIIQYYKVTGDSRVIHSKLIPKKRDSSYTAIIKGLKNNVQYLFQVVGVNRKGLGALEQGNVVLTQSDIKLFK